MASAEELKMRLRLLELEEEEYQDSLLIAKSKPEESSIPEKDDGYFSGINKAMYDKAEEYAPKLLKDERYPLQHAVQKFNAFVDIPLAGLGKAAEPITKPLGKVLKPLTKGLLEGAAYAGGARKANFDNSTEALGEAITPVIKKYDEIKKQYPLVETAGEFVGDVGQLAGNVTGIGAAAKLSTMAGKELVKAPLKAGTKLEEAGKGFKLGDMKIKDTVARKGYGKDLIEKKQNIVNTIQEWGLTHGNNQVNADKAGEILNGIFTKTDDIVRTVAADPMSPKKNPLQAAIKNLNIEALADIDQEDAAKDFVEKLTKKFKEKGFDSDLSIDKLIDVKQSLDRQGNLFKRGPSGSLDDDLKTAIKKKMYLNLVNEIADISPDLKALNTEAKKLMDAQASLLAAASRTSNKDAISLTDWVMGASAVIDPKAIPMLALKKGLSNGRGSNLVLNTARALKGDKVKTIDDILASVKKPEPMGKRTIADLPSDWNIPAYQRKGVKPEIFTPITDKKRLLPAPMLDGEPLNIQKPIPSIGDRIRAIGQIKKDVPLVERLALPSPEDIKMQYPHFSKENIRKPIAPFNDRKALPAPMIGDLLQEIEKQVPTMGQRLERIGTEVKIFDRPTTSGMPISADIEKILSNRGLVEEALERMKNMPKEGLSKDQIERMNSIADFLIKNTGKATK